MAVKSFITLAIVAIVLPTVAMATESIVGDDSGWTVNFHVGDKLVFKYTPVNHDVFKVNGTGFNECIKPPPNEALATGNDIITLAATGNKWYICGLKRHCADHGMKLAITVQAPNSVGFQIAWSVSQVIVAAMIFIAMIIM